MTARRKIVQRFSEARGRDVEMLIISTTRKPVAGLPVALLLHGRGGSARYAAVGGLGDALAEAVTAGAVAPFALVALDGGNSYWHDQSRDDRPMTMLLDEVPTWLAEEGLAVPDGLPFACAGVSMGGFGALLYARRRHERAQPLRGVTALSPGLFTTWEGMKSRNAFSDAEQWAVVDPLQHVDKLGNVKVGMWIGDKDAFVGGARQFMAEAKPAVASIGPGGHTSAYFRSVNPEIVRFLGGCVPIFG